MSERAPEPAWVAPALHITGITCAVAVVLSGIGMLLGLLFKSASLLTTSAQVLVVAVIVPYVTMRIHLSVASRLTARQKQDWRRVSVWGLFGLVTPFFYLTRRDRRLRKG